MRDVQKTSEWTARQGMSKRRVRRDTPRGKARCESCRKEMPYDIGSIAWGCVERDLCGACAGREAAQRVIAAVAREMEPNDAR